MPFGIIGQTGQGMRQVVGFGDRSMGRGTFGQICNQWGLYVIRVWQRCDTALFPNYFRQTCCYDYYYVRISYMHMLSFCLQPSQAWAWAWPASLNYYISSVPCGLPITQPIHSSNHHHFHCQHHQKYKRQTEKPAPVNKTNYALVWYATYDLWPQKGADPTLTTLEPARRIHAGGLPLTEGQSHNLFSQRLMSDKQE